MGCLGECWETGPPPDNILNLPPPPLPNFFQHPISDLLQNTTPCSSMQLCESWLTSNTVTDSEDYVDMSRKDIETWSITKIDDTWLLVLVASSIGVLLLGALLAMFLLKCREMNMFNNNECSVHIRNHHPIKNLEPRECTSVANMNSSKLVHPSETILYHGSTNISDNRMLWAALTPRGTQHFIAENYPNDLIDYSDPEEHYETIDHIEPRSPSPSMSQSQSYQKGLTLKPLDKNCHFDNSGFVDYDYEEPIPQIESYQLNNIMENRGYTIMGNTDMRCLGLMNVNQTMHREMSFRPKVSLPTRIEHPNLPPLNLYPAKGTIKKNNCTLRNFDNHTLHKYSC